MAESNNDPQFEAYRQRLVSEVTRGNLVMIKALAKKNPALLNCMSKKRWTFLHVAAVKEKSNVVEWLLSDEGRAAGFDNVLAKADGNRTALHAAAGLGSLECFKAIVYGCKVENGQREHMLNAVDDEGNTVLHYAAAEGNSPIIKWLLSDKKGGGRLAGFNNIFPSGDKLEITALHRAAERGDLENFIAIVEGCKVENGEREKMLNAFDGEDFSVLHFAARHNHPSIIKWLLSKGRDLGFTSILATDRREVSALHIAAHEGYLEACKAIVAGCKVENGERARMLNSAVGKERTALHYAALDGRTSVVSWLLSDKQGGGRAQGFTIFFVGGNTALHFAAQQGHLETCKAIVKGCKVDNSEREKMMNAVDKHGLTVLHYAACLGRSNIVAWLLSHDADGGRALELKNETITAMINDSHSALHFAAQSGSVETLRALLSGCTVGERLKLFLTVDDKGWTPLYYAAQFGRSAIIRELLLHHEETKMIVDHRDHRGMTALHRVVLNGGFGKKSKEEWKIDVKRDDPNRAAREEVVAALLTYEIDDEDDEKGGQGQPTSSTKKGYRKQQQQQKQEQKQQQQQQEEQQQQQAAFIDVNLGLKIE